MKTLRSQIVAVMGVALLALPLFAETDPFASRWIDAIKDGTSGSVAGKNGELRSPRVTETLRGPTSLRGVPTNATTTATDDYMTVQRTTITATALPLSVTYGGSGTNSSGGVQFFTFPEGRVLVHGVTLKNVTVTPTYTNNGFMGNDDGDFGVGTVTAAGSDITSTEVDLCPKTTLSTMTNATDAALAASAQFDGTTTAKAAFFNLLVDADEITGGSTATVSFTASVLWSLVGDY